MASVEGASDAIPEYYGRDSAPSSFSSELVQESAWSQFFLFIWSLISGQYNEFISRNATKIIGFVSVTWKFFLFVVVLMIFIGWWIRKRNQRIQRYRELKNKQN